MCVRYGKTDNVGSVYYESLLTSTLAAGIVQDTFAGEAEEGEGGEEETTGGYFYRSWLEILPFLSKH